MNGRYENHEPPVSESLRGVSDGIARLVREHVELAKLELRASAKRVGRDAVLTGAGAFMLGVGYLTLMFCIGYALAGPLGNALAFLVVAAANLVVGGVLVAIFAGRLADEDRPRLEQTQRELQRDKDFAKNLGHVTREHETPHTRH